MIERAKDDLRPKGTIEVECACGCRWAWWIDPLDPRLPNRPFYMDGCGPECSPGCDGTPSDSLPTEKCIEERGAATARGE